MAPPLKPSTHILYHTEQGKEKRQRRGFETFLWFESAGLWYQGTLSATAAFVAAQGNRKQEQELSGTDMITLS